MIVEIKFMGLYKRVLVQKNPALKDAIRLLNLAEKQELKGVRAYNDVYLWDAFDMSHYEFIEYLGLLDSDYLVLDGVETIVFSSKSGIKLWFTKKGIK